MEKEKLVEKIVEMLSQVQNSGEHVPKVVENLITYKMYLHSSLAIAYVVFMVLSAAVIWITQLRARDDFEFGNAVLVNALAWIVPVMGLPYSLASVAQMKIAPVSYVIETVLSCKP